MEQHIPQKYIEMSTHFERIPSSHGFIGNFEITVPCRAVSYICIVVVANMVNYQSSSMGHTSPTFEEEEGEGVACTNIRHCSMKCSFQMNQLLNILTKLIYVTIILVEIFFRMLLKYFN